METTRHRTVTNEYDASPLLAEIASDPSYLWAGWRAEQDYTAKTDPEAYLAYSVRVGFSLRVIRDTGVPEPPVRRLTASGMTRQLRRHGFLLGSAWARLDG